MNRYALGGMIALSLLSGCGSSDKEVSAAPVDKPAVSVATAESKIVTVTDNGKIITENVCGPIMPAEAPDLPDYAPIYPGADIKTRVASASSEEGTGSLIAMHTSDSLEKVVAFYDQKAKKAPIPPNIVTNDEDAAIRIYGDEASGEGALLAISREKGGSGTVIVITRGKGKLAPIDKEAANVAASQGVRLQ